MATRGAQSVWLDGIIGGLAVAAVGTAVVFQAVLKMLGGSPAAVATKIRPTRASR